MARSFARASSQYLTADSAPATGVPLTMACWFLPDGLGGGSLAYTAMCVGDGSTANNKFFRLGVYQEKFIAQQTNSSGGYSQAAATVTDLTWTHGVGVFSANNSRTAYVNGAAEAGNTANVTAFTANQTRIGWRPYTGSLDYWNGHIAHAAIWNVALTADEVAALYNSGIGADPRSIRPDALVAYWPLLDNDGDRDWWRNTHLTPTDSPTYAQHPPVLMKSRPTVVVMGGSSAPTISSVTISGTRQIGQTITATVATSPTPVDSIAYQWQKAATDDATPGTDLTGKTSQTLALSYEDFGDLLDSDSDSVYVRCQAIATNGGKDSDEVASDWLTVSLPAGGGVAGSPLKSPFLIA